MRNAFLLLVLFGTAMAVGCTEMTYSVEVQEPDDPVIDVAEDDVDMNAAIDKAQATVDVEVQEPDDPVIDVAEDDVDMNAAIDKARATVDKFIEALNQPESERDFSVKLLITDGDAHEHMWLTPVRLEGTTFIGVLNNKPGLVSNVEFGDELKVEKDQISDWMIVDGKKIWGAYTLRVLMEKLPPEERATMPRSLEFLEL
ncbi:YegJ family protein [Aeoliella mucimassa]|uniref:DUF2314 domain-containing protein n=1 Tax=Aeoliella mucimassa TaxID=2527972 RepID=A0A518AHY8_9BACT|nr:DUF2314 domain-containing protein [Aeoliella mucimassa]QDU54342.1 hypothetical protein Pan181_05230 [Aeoliella mucimassa]